MNEENMKYTVTEDDAVNFQSFVDEGWKEFEEKHRRENGLKKMMNRTR